MLESENVTSPPAFATIVAFPALLVSEKRTRSLAMIVEFAAVLESLKLTVLPAFAMIVACPAEAPALNCSVALFVMVEFAALLVLSNVAPPPSTVLSIVRSAVPALLVPPKNKKSALIWHCPRCR